MSALIPRNVYVRGQRTSLRLEQPLWEELQAIARRHGRTVHDICSDLASRKPAGHSLTSSVRTFIVHQLTSARAAE